MCMLMWYVCGCVLYPELGVGTHALVCLGVCPMGMAARCAAAAGYSHICMASG